MFKWIPVLLLLSGMAQAAGMQAEISAEPTNYAWWLRATFNPVHTSIRGVPLSRIDRTLLRASELNRSYIPIELLFEGGIDNLKENGLSFAATGDFNGDRIPDLALTGVYLAKNGETGRFLLILTVRRIGEWKVKHFERTAGRAGFSAVSVKDGKVGWWSCMECDNGSFLIWNQEQKRYEWEPEEKDE